MASSGAEETRPWKIAVIPGDGIGPEVIRAAVPCISAAAEVCGRHLDYTWLPWGSKYYHEHGRMMPDDGLELLRQHDAILLGAVGDPGIPDVTTLWGLLIPIRRAFDQYVNLRPVRLLPGVTSPLRCVETLDIVVVRENAEGEYSDVGGGAYHGTPSELALQVATFTRRGVARVGKYAAELAHRRGKRLTSATKSNGIIHTMPFWDSVIAAEVASFSGVEFESILIDALAARIVLDPAHFDVIVASNLFGDILSDLCAAVAGSIGVAPSANLNPTGEYPSMFEPVHGSAPDIAGKGIANPVGSIWAGAMMLDHLGCAPAAQILEAAIETALASGISTPDLGGTASTEEFAALVRTHISRSSQHSLDHGKA